MHLNIISLIVESFTDAKGDLLILAPFKLCHDSLVYDLFPYFLSFWMKTTPYLHSFSANSHYQNEIKKFQDKCRMVKSTQIILIWQQKRRFLSSSVHSSRSFLLHWMVSLIGCILSCRWWEGQTRLCPIPLSPFGKHANTCKGDNYKNIMEHVFSPIDRVFVEGTATPTTPDCMFKKLGNLNSCLSVLRTSNKKDKCLLFPIGIIHTPS